MEGGNFGENTAANVGSPQASPREGDPYAGDENTYQEHFRKTFITENQKNKDD